MEFAQWIIRHGEYQDKTARCDTCRDKHEAEEERMRQANKAMVIPSNIQPSFNAHTHVQDQPSCKPMVTIYCSGCDHGKELDMNMFWHKTKEKHRFQKISCISCKKSCRLGKWLRRPQEADNSIEEWLKHNNAIAKDKDRPAYMTVDLYLSQNIKEERALKRNAPHDAPTKTAKRMKQK